MSCQIFYYRQLYRSISNRMLINGANSLYLKKNQYELGLHCQIFFWFEALVKEREGWFDFFISFSVQFSYGP